MSSWAVCSRGFVYLDDGGKAAKLVPLNGTPKAAWTVAAEPTEEFLAVTTDVVTQQHVYILSTNGPCERVPPTSSISQNPILPPSSVCRL